jgi:hypothetical protein
MAHLLTSDSKSSDFAYDDAYRCFSSPEGNNRLTTGSAERRGQPVRFRASRTVRRVRGYLKNMIEAIADSKMRRVERELELRGIRYDRSSNDWVSCNSGRVESRKG